MIAKYSILIAEDDKEILFFLKKAFVRSGFTVITATDGQEAISAAKKYHPEIILLDISLPKKDGIEVLNNLKSKASDCKDIPVVVLSCLDRPDEIRAGLKAGAIEYICKPAFPDDLINKVLLWLQKLR